MLEIIAQQLGDKLEAVQNNLHQFVIEKGYLIAQGKKDLVHSLKEEEFGKLCNEYREKF